MEEQHTLYAGIMQPTEIRSMLLGCSRDIISVLQRYDALLDIRREKIEQIICLKKELGEIKRLQSILKEKLPNEGVAKAPVQALPKRLMKRKVSAISAPHPEIKELEAELNEIEERLNRINS